MSSTDEDRAHEVLEQGECLRLLATAGIGRVAYTQAALPAIRLVSFSVRGADVLVHAPRTSPFVRAVRGSVVAFEADDYDPWTRTGWAVTVVGPTRVLDDDGAGARAPGCVVALHVGLVEGWRTTVPERPSA